MILEGRALRAREETMKSALSTSAPFLAAALAAGLFGCSSRPVKASPALPAAQTPAAAPSAGPSEEAAGEPSLRNTMLQPIADVRTVYFDYNSAELTAAARSLLGANAAWLKDHPGASAQVAGHCDPRGTEEYNMALGQRRAKAVRDYYKELGVPGGKVATISYGKDKPACREENEACWQKDRRAETWVAAPEAVSGIPKEPAR